MPLRSGSNSSSSSDDQGDEREHGPGYGIRVYGDGPPRRRPPERPLSPGSEASGGRVRSPRSPRESPAAAPVVATEPPSTTTTSPTAEREPGGSKETILQMIEGIARRGGRISIIYNYLQRVQRENGEPENKMPTQEEVENNLIWGFRGLETFPDQLPGTPLLNKGELDALYLESDEAKKAQATKDDWLQTFISSDDDANLLDWLTDGESLFDLAPMTPTPTEYKAEKGDMWKDLSLIYSDIYGILESGEAGQEILQKLPHPDSIPETGISINVGKLHDYRQKMRDIADRAIRTWVEAIEIVLTIFQRLGMSAIRIGGVITLVTTGFIVDLFVGIIRNSINEKILAMISGIGRVFAAPFIISNSDGVAGLINDKYKYFLCMIILKTVFMLGRITEDINLEDINLDDKNQIRTILAAGFTTLNEYNNGSTPVPDKRAVDAVMRIMNQLTSWYLLRKTVVLNVNKGDTVSLIENKIEPRVMTADQLEAMMRGGMEPEPEGPPPIGTAQSRKRRPKRKTKHKKTKKKTRKRRSKRKTKHRKTKKNNRSRAGLKPEVKTIPKGFTQEQWKKHGFLERTGKPLTNLEIRFFFKRINDPDLSTHPYPTEKIFKDIVEVRERGKMSDTKSNKQWIKAVDEGVALTQKEIDKLGLALQTSEGAEPEQESSGRTPS